MEKLLHERLRNGLENLVGGTFLLETEGGGCVIYGEQARQIADEIERDYLALPRDPDGKPWKIGDPFVSECGVKPESHRVDGFRHVTNELLGDFWALVDERGVSHELIKCKRPTPKVYDADGVEIKVGDTVYLVDNDVCLPLKVEALPKPGYYQAVQVVCEDIHTSYDPPRLTHEKPVFDAEGVRICKGDTVWDARYPHCRSLTVHDVCTGRVLCVCGLSDWVAYRPEWLTHREPDSLEKLRDYVREQEEQDSSSARDVYHEIGDRLTAFIERGA